MTWMMDEDERLVNIDNWDFIDLQTISDTETGKVIIYKVILSRGENECILGYVTAKDHDHYTLLDMISKGVSVHFSSLYLLLQLYQGKDLDEVDLENPIDR